MPPKEYKRRFLGSRDIGRFEHALDSAGGYKIVCAESVHPITRVLANLFVYPFSAINLRIGRFTLNCEHAMIEKANDNIGLIFAKYT